MSKEKQNIKSPFKFLDPYERKDEAIFFGRDQEVEELYQAVNKNRLVLLYGESGTGKTSVVQCGLGNRFDVTDWMPFFVRRGKNINESLNATLSQSKALGGMQVNNDKVLDALNRISARYVRPVYLIFDQFEELLILGERHEKDLFIQTVKSIMESEKTASCNLIFILREEYFASLDIFEKQIPGFSDRRIRVEPMRPAQIEEVVMSTCAYFKIKLQDGAENARQIIESLKSKGGISLPYLQVYLDMLWREDYARTYPKGWEGEGFPPLEITKNEIKELGAIEDVLERFMIRQEEAIQAELSYRFPEIKPDVVSKILDAFATEEGTKRPVAYTRKRKMIHAADNSPPYLTALSAEVLTEALSLLERSRILRSDEESFELAHDRLAALIDQKRSDEQRQLNEIFRQIESGFKVFQQTHEPLSRKQLHHYEDFLPNLPLTDELKDFVKKSDEIRTKQEQRALKKAEKEAENERSLRKKTEESEKRARRLSKIAWISLGIVVAGILAGAYFGWAAYRFYNDTVSSSEPIVKSLLAGAKENIRQLKYEEAIETLPYAMDLYDQHLNPNDSIMQDLVNQALEVTYFLNESGQTGKAKLLADQVAEKGKDYANDEDLFFINVLKLGDPVTSRTRFNQALQSYDRDFYEFLRKRYYPEMVYVEGGEFEMGCSGNQNCEEDEKPVHREKVDTFFMGKTEVTNFQWSLYAAAETVEQGNIPPGGIFGDHPVVFVSFFDMKNYLDWLNKNQNCILSKENDNPFDIRDPHFDLVDFRLPAEPEWEYAARGGINKDPWLFSGSDTLKKVGWYRGNTVNTRIQPVAQLSPNSLGLYDMSGNVVETCNTAYAPSYSEKREDVEQLISIEETEFVYRGGWVRSYFWDCRNAARGKGKATRSGEGAGFRVAAGYRLH